MFLKKYLFLCSLGLIVSCNADSAYEGLNVSLSASKEPSTVIMTFINQSNTDIDLPAYIFCNSNFLYMDLFKIQKNSKKDKNDLGYYGGLVDFVTQDMLVNGKKIKLMAKEKKSCDINLARFYSFYETGDFDVNYELHENLLDLTSPLVLSSNMITVKFQKSELKGSQ